MNELLADRAREYGAAGRSRAATELSWSTVAARTVRIYRTLLD